MVILLRPPTAAGNFYEINPEMLKKQLNHYLKDAETNIKKKTNVLGAIVPHSPYIYSGKIAAKSCVNFTKSNFVILGSNHMRYGANFALIKNCLWKTPIGEAIVDDRFAERLLKECKLVEFDAIPHENEFSIEVQLPFLLHKFGDVRFLPLVVNNLLPDDNLLESCRIVGSAIGKLIKKNGNWKLIGSSDLSQNKRGEPTELVDKQLIKHIVKMDAKGLFNRINKTNASVCGYGAVATTIFAAKEIGAKKSKLLGYGTSFEVNDTDSVTGYASIIFY